VSTYSGARTVRRKRSGTNPLTVLVVLLVLAAIPVLGYVAWVVMNKPPDVIVTTEVVKPDELPPKKQKPVEPLATAASEATEPGKPKKKTSKSKRQAEKAIPDGPPPKRSVAGARYRIVQDLRAALALDKRVLVIWLVDQSASAKSLRQEVAGEFDEFYKDLAPARAALPASEMAAADKPTESKSTDGAIAADGAAPADAQGSAEAKEPMEAATAGEEKKDTGSATGGDAPLLSAVAGYADTSEFPEAPTADAQLAKAAFEKLGTREGFQEKTFGAVRAAVEKYADYRLVQQRFVTIILVTDEAGDDETETDSTLTLCEHYAIPVYCIGDTAPFGRIKGDREGLEGKRGDPEIHVRQGPESRFPEWIHLEYPGGVSESDNAVDTQLGPYSLSRLCRRSGGEYFALNTSNNFDFAPQRGRGRGAAAVTDSATLTRAYLPEDLSEAALQADLAANKAKKALVAAAQLSEPAQSLKSTLFTVDNSDDVKRNRALDDAQKPVARVLPPLIQLVDLLKAGEADEPKLVEPRWKAGFDLAYGRALAALARAQGYNNMLATMKAGRKFTNESSRDWVLQPSDKPTKDSVVDKMADKARTYLKGIIEKYPGTPWAKSAERELQEAIGWEWVER
jgi:hypothetical protein